MPARVASGARNVRKAAATKTDRTSSPITKIPDEGDDSSLRRRVCQAFADAQKSTAGHRKAVISLRKTQEACCYEPVSGAKDKPRTSDEFDEEAFNNETMRCILRVLPVKKSEAVADRVVRFVGTFLNVAGGKDNEIAHEDNDNGDGALPETPTSRLTSKILSTLLPLLRAKDKVIRFRATQITSHIINSLDTLDDSLFHQLRYQLLRRIHDKEAPVRLQAVYGLGRLATEVETDEQRDDSDSEDDLGAGVLGKLLGVLQHDPSAEVRRNLLLNLPLTKEVLPYLLERARDADASTRRALYARLLPALGDFRHLSLTHREKLLRWGMRDRDENVRQATAKLFCERWIEDCAALPAAQAIEQNNGEQEKRPESMTPSLDALLELLERIDVVNSGTEGGIALIAMSEFWKLRPDYVDYVSFPASFWEDLSPELAFVARTFNDHCRGYRETGYRGPDLEALVEEKLPEVIKFGFLLDHELKRLTEATLASATNGEEDDDEGVVHREFVVEQLLRMALTFDYSDEVGRRRLFGLLREALALPDLPEETTRLVIENLRLVCGEDAKGEREFCGVVLEAIAEVHDTIMCENDDGEGDSTNESFHSATSFPDAEDDDTVVAAQRRSKKKPSKDSNPDAEQEKAVREIMVNMKCLHIALCMLQNVQCVLEENIHLVTMLNNLVVPAVRSQEAPIRERGLLCLGLCCLLGKNLAQENLTLFLHCFAKGHAALQAIALQIITDILITHPTLISTPSASPTEASEQHDVVKAVIKAFKQSLRSDDVSVQSTGATALSKAMLSRLIVDNDLLKQLVVTYFDPDSASNAQLRQSLSYFLPVYCHSRAENAAQMAEITVSAITKLTTLSIALAEDSEEEAELPSSDEMVKLNQIGIMLLDWTDPRKIVGFNEASQISSVADGAGETHLILAEQILERLVTSNPPKEEKKVLFSMINKLHLRTGGADAERLKTILELAAEAVESKVSSSTTDKNALTKLQNCLLKMMHDVMTRERGGGGAEDTVVETTEHVEQSNPIPDVQPRATAKDNDEDEDDSDSTHSLKDTDLGGETMGFTTGLPDAEGTRIGLDVDDDTEMMDSER